MRAQLVRPDVIGLLCPAHGGTDVCPEIFPRRRFQSGKQKEKHVDYPKAGCLEHALEAAAVGEDEREMKLVSLIRKIVAERVGEDAP